MKKNLALLFAFILTVTSSMVIAKPAISSVATVEDSWKLKSPMPAGGAVYGAATVNGKIYAFGAYNYNATTYYTTGKYDPATDRWSAIAPMPTARIEFATTVHENKMYIIGGKKTRGDASLDNVEVYDPATNSWSSKASMPTARDSMQANVVNGRIYVISGEISHIEAHAGAVFSDATEVYEPGTDTWASAAPIPNHVAGYAS